MIWHFLKFNKEIDSTRTDSELEQLKADTISLIETIEQDETFQASPSVLCEWCEFKPCCRQWRHLYTVSERPANQYLADSGVKLVNRYAELKNKQKQVIGEFEDELEKLEEALIAFAEKEQVDCVFGSKNKVRIAVSEKYSFPGKNSKERVRLEELLRKYGKLAEVQQLDTAALGTIIAEKEWSPEVLAALTKYVELEKKKRLYLSDMKER